jgi:hypothetical protein
MTSTLAPGTSPDPDGSTAPEGSEAPVESPTIETCRAQHRQLQLEVSRYIELLLGELSTMAKAAELRHLLHFIELTRQEAGDQTRRCRIDR